LAAVEIVKPASWRLNISVSSYYPAEGGRRAWRRRRNRRRRRREGKRLVAPQSTQLGCQIQRFCDLNLDKVKN
jgi:hypothetical protein